MRKYLAIFVTIIIVCVLSLNSILSQRINIPVLMYHDITLEDTGLSIQVTKDKFFEDMKYLSDNGYTPLLPDQLLKIRQNEKNIPEKPIVITFDDGYLSNFEYAYPILQQTQMKAIISIVTSNIRDENGNGNDYFMTYDQCKQMQESGIVYIANHTHDLHNSQAGGLYIDDGINGIQKYKTESSDEYKQRLYSDLKQACENIENYIGIKTKVFVYPYGVIEKDAYSVFEELGIELAFSTKPKIANLSGKIYELSRFNVTMDTSLEEILS